MHRRHAGRRRAAGFGPFQRRKPRFQHADRGVAEARILVMHFRASKGAFRRGRAVIDKARGQIHRFRQLIEIGTHKPTANKLRRRAKGAGGAGIFRHGTDLSLKEASSP